MANEQLQPDAGNAGPMTEEDRFAAEVQAERDRQAEADKPAGETATPQPRTDARDARDAGAGDGGEGRARGPDGKFLPAGATGGRPEPFEGYSAMPEAQRKAVDKLLTERERAISRAAAAQRDLEATRRRTPQPSRPPANRPATPPVQPQQPRKLPKWDAAAQGEFKDTFESIEERIAAGESDLGRRLTAFEHQQAEIAQNLQETRAIADRFRHREEAENAKRAIERLGELSPNWKRTAGWVDDEGREVPEGQQTFAPEFEAWLGALPKSVRILRERELKSGDPDILGSVFQLFDRDYAEAMGWPERGPGNAVHATPRNPVTERRAAALNDTQRRPNGASPRRDPVPQPGNRMDAEEAAFAAATTEENMQKWRGLRQ